MHFIYPEESERIQVIGDFVSSHHAIGHYETHKVIMFDAYGNRSSASYLKPYIARASIKDILKACCEVLKTDSASWNCPKPKTVEEDNAKLPAGSTHPVWRKQILFRGYHSYQTYHYAKDDTGYRVKVEGENGWLYTVTKDGTTEVLTGTGKYLKVTLLNWQEYKPVGKRGQNDWAFRYEGDLDLIYQATSGHVGHSAGYGGASPEYPEDGIVVMYQSNSCD